MWARVPFRFKLLHSSGSSLKNLSQFGISLSIAQHFNYHRFQSSRLFTPCLSLWDTRSFHSSPKHYTVSLHNSLRRDDSSTSLQRPLPISPTFPSVPCWPTTHWNFKSFQRNSIIASRVNIVNFESLYQQLSPSGQIRFLHGYSSRKRVSRTFSSQNKSSEDKNNELKVGEQTVKTDEDTENKLTVYQRFKKTYKEHGKVLIVVHLMTSAVWFGSFYTAARCGVDVVPLLENWNLGEKVIAPFRSGGLGDVALAYLMYKLVTPARYTVTLAGTNLAVRYLRREGKIQPVPKEDSLRELYKDGKEDLKSKGKRTRHRLRHMRHRIQGRIRRVRKRHHPHDRRDH